MAEWWASVATLEKVFWYIAVPFTVVFVLQLVLSIIGIDHESDVDGGHVGFGHDVDVGHDVAMGHDMDMGHDFGDHDAAGAHDHGHAHHSGELVPFQLITFRNIVVFFTIFGWTGIVATNYGFGLFVTMLLALPAGLLMMVAVSALFYYAARLTESGTQDIRLALLKSGTVYLTIPGHRQGAGKIHVEFQGALRELEAVTEGDTLPTGTEVRVVEVLPDAVVVVTKQVNL
ncbi:MAG: hypothetical protein JXQ27_09480 [Acidobacteria bacterium]|nr:hypothetical protein [Acidobacteriota bacterium]